MKHRQCKSSVRELHRADICNPGAIQAARQRQSPATLGHRENYQRHNLVAQIRACWRQMGRCRAFALTPIPISRQQTLDHGGSLFFYSLARTTLLCNQAGRPSTRYNCRTICPIGRSSSAWQAGPSRRFGAYHRHRVARWPTCPSRFLASPRRAGAASPANPAYQLLASDPRKA